MPVEWPQPRPFLVVAWLMLLVSVPLLSVFGRDLQQLLARHYTGQQLAWAIALALGLLTTVAVVLLLRSRRAAGAWQLLWFIPLFLIAPHFLSIVEERVHFIVFGLLGFFTLKLFPRTFAYALCLLMAVADEGLQWSLPDRVGDLRDVAVNLVAAWAGVTLAWVMERQSR